MILQKVMQLSLKYDLLKYKLFLDTGSMHKLLSEIIFCRSDIGYPTRRWVLQSLTLQTGTVAVILYLASLVCSLCAANLEDKINLYDKFRNLWTTEQVRLSEAHKSLRYIQCQNFKCRSRGGGGGMRVRGPDPLPLGHNVCIGLQVDFNYGYSCRKVKDTEAQPTVPFYTPVFRRDVLWYGDVRPSGSPSVRHSFPHFSPTCSEILSWNFVYHFILMHVKASLNAINFRQFLLELCPFLTSNSHKYAVFRTFSYMLWDIKLKFCIWLCYTVILIKFECRPFASILWELCPCWNLEYWKYTVFHTFLLHALTYWVEILHMTLFYCTTDQVWVSSISVNFCGSYAPFGT